MILPAFRIFRTNDCIEKAFNECGIGKERESGKFMGLHEGRINFGKGRILRMKATGGN